MKYAVEMASVAMIYTPSSIQICLGIHKSLGLGDHRHTDRMEIS